MNEPHHILFIEDEPALGEIIKESLENRGYKVSLYKSGNDGFNSFLSSTFSLILLDVMLPDVNGYAVAKKIRQINQEIPILFLTAKSLPQNVVEGFESGGNDYLKKPFGLEELVIRIKVLLTKDRRLISENEPVINADIGNYKFHYERQLLVIGSTSQKLSSKEAELLKLLYNNRNRVIERKIILLKLWQDDHFFNSRSLDVYITKLRKHLGKDPYVQIINYRGIGYKFVC